MRADNVTAVLEEVDQLLLAERLEDAMERLDQARRLDPSNPQVFQRLGDAYRAKGRTADALRAYDEAIALAPGRAKLWSKRGDALLDAGRPDEAIAAFEKASRLAPDEFTPLDWSLRGDRCFERSDYETAARFYRKSLAVKPNGDAWHGLGAIEQAVGRFEKALAYYEKGLTLDPGNVQLLNARGLALRDLGRGSEAIECFGQVVARDPESLQGWLNLGLVLREQGHVERARDAYVRATELQSDRADTWLELGLCEQDIGEREQALRTALRSFERAIELDADSFWGWNNAGWALGELGEYNEALARLDRAIQIDEVESVPWDNKVTLLLQHGDLAQARACIDRMVRVVRNRAEALGTKSYLLTEWLGEDDEALEAVREASDLAPDNVWIAANLAEILLKVGKYKVARSKARALLDKVLQPHERCAMLFIVYASYVLERRMSRQRASAFHDFIDYFRAHYVKGTPKERTWTYRGLLRKVLTKLSLDEESTFLLSMAIDLQVGTFEPAKTAFFAADAKPAPAEVTAS